MIPTERIQAARGALQACRATIPPPGSDFASSHEVTESEPPEDALLIRLAAREARKELGTLTAYGRKVQREQEGPKRETSRGGGWDEQWRCGWCTGFVIGPHSTCPKCGHEPSVSAAHSRGNARGASTPAKRARAAERKRRNRLRL